MERLDLLDATMMTGELLGEPLHVAAVLILAPPDDAGPQYVDATGFDLRTFIDEQRAAVLAADSDGGMA